MAGAGVFECVGGGKKIMLEEAVAKHCGVN